MESFHQLIDQEVPGPDGITLATDVYLPSESGAFPVVMERTPYGKQLHSRSEVNADGHKVGRKEMADAFCKAGIGVIFQDVRGRYGSSGSFTKYINEARDGLAGGNWIADQPWCNGNIGTMGLSYAAHTQLALACLSPTWLKGMVLDSGGFFSAFDCGIRQGGAFELKQATWAVKQSRIAKGNSGELSDEETQELRDWFRRMPWSETCSPLKDSPEYLDYLLEQWRNGTYSNYWKQLGLSAKEHFEAIPNIPVLHMSSWFDAYVPSTLSNYEGMKKKNTSQQLIMGPWIHGDRNVSHSGAVDFGPEAIFDNHFAQTWLEYRVNWFSRLFSGAGITPMVDVFEMGGGPSAFDHGGKWIEASHWPLPESSLVNYFPHVDGVLRLSPASPPEELELLADPHNPVPTIGGAITSGKPIFSGGSFPQIETSDFFGTDGSGQDLANRDDVLSFSTPPLTEDVVVAGEVNLTVSIRSEVPDFDVTVKLLDVYPDGTAINITDGIARARYRNDPSNPELVTPGDTVEVTVKAFETMNRFKVGHRIRLDIAGSNFPHFDVNPNSGEPEGYADNKRVARNKLLLAGTKLTLRVA